MATRDYATSPVSDSLMLKPIIIGLAGDLESLRAGNISPSDGLARAAVAKQIFNGVRLYLHAMKSLEQNARSVAESLPCAGHLKEGR